MAVRDVQQHKKISTLRAEVLVSSGRGRRSVVLGRFNSEDFDSILSISHWLESRGLDAESGSIHSHLFEKGVDYDNAHRLPTLVYASDEDAQALACEPGAPLWCVPLELSD